MKKQATHIVLIPDSATLLQMHREQQLDNLFSDFATLAIADSTVHELLRHCGSEGHNIALWIKKNHITILETRAFNHGRNETFEQAGHIQGAVAEISLQELMNEINLSAGRTKVVFLLDEFKCVSKDTFLFGSFCVGVTLRAYQQFLENLQPNPGLIPHEKPSQNTGKTLTKTPLALDPTSPLSSSPAPLTTEEKGIFINRTLRSNPKLVEKELREIFSQTVNIGLKAIDKVKFIRQPDVAKKPDPSAIDKFRRHLM